MPDPTRPADESWFGVLGVGADTQMRAEDTAAGESGYETGWGGAALNDRRVLSRQARRILNDPDSALTRIYRTYAAARAAIGAALIAGIGATSLVGANPSILLGLLCLAYAGQAITLWMLPRFGALTQPQPQDSAAQRRRQWLSTIGVDLLAFTALHVLVSRGSLNFAALLVSAGADVRRADVTAVVAGHCGSGGADAAAGRLACRGGRCRQRGADHTVRPGRHWLLRHRPAGR